MDLSLPYTQLPLNRQMEVTDHMFIPFYLMWSMEIPWIFPYQQSSMILFISTSSYASFHFPYWYDQGSTVFHHNGHTPASLSSYPPYVFLFTLLYFILLCLIHHRLYVYTCNLSLTLKAIRASKELYSSSLVISPSKECKQDRVDQSFKFHFLLLHTAWHSAWRTVPFVLFVGLLQHVYTRSTNTYHISPYPVPMGPRVSHRQ